MLKLRIPPHNPSNRTLHVAQHVDRHVRPHFQSGAAQSAPAGSQRGVSLIVALVVLIALTLSGVALIRSMDTTNLIAGNLSFKQATTQGADQGVETAIAWLAANNSGGFLNNDLNNGNSFYVASTIGNDAIATLGSTENFWRNYTNNDSASVPCYLPMAGASLIGGSVCAGAPTRDATSGNIVGFIIQRLCNAQGLVSVAGCSVPIVTSGGSVITGSGNNEGAGDVATTSGSITVSTMVYYRITARAQGPNNTTSYVQAIVAMGS